MTNLKDALGTTEVAILATFFLIFLKSWKEFDFKPFPSSLLTER
jgi:hypothetical protein